MAGTVAVVVLTRLARRLTGSTLLGLLAGLLLALDGFSFSLVADRPARRLPADVRRRARSPAWSSTGTGSARGSARRGPVPRPASGSGPRGWRIAAGVPVRLRLRGEVERRLVPRLLRRPVAVLGPRGLAGGRRSAADAGRRCAAGCPGAAWALGAVPVLTYLASFTGWFLGETSQGKAWAQQHPHTAFPFVPDALRSLWHEHARVADVPQRPVHARTRGSPSPWSWLVDGRPILLWNPQGLTDAAGEPVDPLHPDGRDADALVRLRARRCCGCSGGSSPGATRRRSPSRSAIAAGWLTWFINLERTMFIFYMAPAVPFFVLAVTLALQDVARPRPDADPLRRQVGLGRGVPLRRRRRRRPSSSSIRCSPAARCRTSQWLLRMWFPSWF